MDSCSLVTIKDQRVDKLIKSNIVFQKFPILPN